MQNEILATMSDLSTRLKINLTTIELLIIKSYTRAIAESIL